MAKKKTHSGFITIDEIRALLKKRLGIVASRAAVYGYIARKGFPKNLGLGTPRRWRADEVLQWIEKYEERKLGI